MNELMYMSSKCNSLEGVKERYKKGIIESFKWLGNNKDIIRQEIINRGLSGREGQKEVLRQYFRNMQYRECADNSIGSNDRWGIVGERNLFGLEAEIAPSEAYKAGEELSKDKRWFLKANSGRFQPQKFPVHLFKNFINISDILERKEEEQFSELEIFYKMNNREVFEKFGVSAQGKDERMLLANSILLDSLLEDKYTDIKSIWCGKLSEAYNIQVEMNNGTRIVAGDPDYQRGITIEREGKKAIVQYDVIDKIENRYTLENINDLEVENVVYDGDNELIDELKQAMSEQFKSQREDKSFSNEDVLNLLYESGREGMKEQAEQEIINSKEQSLDSKEKEGVNK